MAAIVMDGNVCASALKNELKSRVAELKQHGITPGLGSLLVGEDPASATYVANKLKSCDELGIRSFHAHLEASVTKAQLHDAIRALNENPKVDAILLQLPLPKHLDEEQALLAISPVKDVDGLHPVNLGKLVMNVPGPLPCTPAGIQQMLKFYNVPVKGKHVVVVGRGLTIGRPAALLFAMKGPFANAAVTVVHTGVDDLKAYTQQSDIVIAAAGTPGLVTKDMIKPGAAVVGAGISREGKRILSDVDEDVAEVAGWVTPRIGGVGPMTIAMLLNNTVLAAEKRLAQSENA